MALEIKGRTQSLQWISDLLAFFQTETIKVPLDYRSRVIETKKLLNNDASGLVNTMLDFAVTSSLVDYRIETTNANLTTILNDWLRKINFKLRGKIPTGLEALAKEYFRERWKASSNLLLRTFWEENSDGLILPTTLFFVDGEDIVIKKPKDPTKPVSLGEEEYALRVNANRSADIDLPRSSNEEIFVQKPFESWGVKEPVPYFIKQGLFRNVAFYNMMSEKSEFIIGRALEYLFVVKKGTEKLAADGRAEFIYDEEDLKGIRDDLKKILLDKKNSPGAPTYTTNFDTELEHLIPDYKKAIEQAIYDPIEKRLLAGLGMINIVEGVGASRRESMLNPKPFIEEVKQGIKDFKCLLRDIIHTIIEKNLSSHKKWMNTKIDINHTPIKAFLTDKTLATLRSIYDRGRLSSRSLVEVVADMDYDLEVERRKAEKESGDDDALYPPVIQNQEQYIDDLKKKAKDTEINKNDTVIPDDKKGIEKKNFTLATIVQCKDCFHEGTVEEFTEHLEESSVEDGIFAICPGCDKGLKDEEILITSRIIGEPRDPRRTQDSTHHTPQSKKKKKKSPYAAETGDEKVYEYEEGKVVKRKDGWHVISKNGKNLGGPFKTKKEAVKRLRQVEFFKNQ